MLVIVFSGRLWYAEANGSGILSIDWITGRCSGMLEFGRLAVSSCLLFRFVSSSVWILSVMPVGFHRPLFPAIDHINSLFGKSSLYQMSISVAAVVGAASGGLALLVFVIGFLWFYILHFKKPANRNSETGSSDPSNLAVEWNRRDRISSAGCGLTSEYQSAKQFTLEELEEATKNFSESNLVGTGTFGSVYKGLLLDGTIVAIKRRVSVPRLTFVEEVKNLSEIRHRNLVTLIGYCQEGGLQMLVFEYLLNGSISRHLYDSEQHSLTRLEFKQRLTVATGAAKGLAYLHSLAPPLVHKDFKTSNVLVDDNFIAKVADACVIRLLRGSGEVGPQGSNNIFQDPEVGVLGRFSEASDVYSFGVFLLELISGVDVAHCALLDSYSFLAQWVEAHTCSSDLIDRRLGNGFTTESMKDLIAIALQCLNPSGQRRPKMRSIVMELDRILETEMALTTVMGDGTTIVTLGSQLFTSS
ncbi:PTI1-like tyrosine-protein kinase [Canna indica]|uniref:non-specific serine/threonine protein kinase n=1 Tax=Canna indica TaxID=4628 RepID=A0AAQ3QGN2_9LILI|nr:PTI1-like tyrosine-protein kinase [Canna indica]